MISVKDILKRGACEAISVTPTDTVYRALQVMAENNVGAVMICDGEQIVGIFTERDYCRKIILMGRLFRRHPYPGHHDQDHDYCSS